MKKPVFASSVTQAFENVLQRKAGDIQPQETEEIDFRGKRILLAEDNEINAEITKNLLEMKGCQVETASNGAEAVESFAAAAVGRYDAILMDVRMPSWMDWTQRVPSGPCAKPTPKQCDPRNDGQRVSGGCQHVS